MINILFVDDDIDIIDGYKRMLFSMRHKWKSYFALSGDIALQLLAAEKIDIIVTDMRMPGMDGAMLLARVKKLYPEILRLVLSGYQDELKAIRATGVAHQFISKPCSADTLKSTIEKSIFLRSYLGNEQMLSVINGLGELPGLPEVYLAIEEELQKPDASLERVAGLVSMDISLVAKILQIVNSSFFGFHVRMTNLVQALSFLGLNVIKSLILHIKIFSLNTAAAGSLRFCESVGAHSIETARIAQKICMMHSANKLACDETFMAAILHDIGKIVLLQLPGYEKDTLRIMSERHIRFEAAEQELFGFTHAEAGAYLLGIWGLPQMIIEPAAFHHKPSASGDAGVSTLTFIHIANNFANLPKNEPILEIDQDNIFDHFPGMDPEYFDRLGIKESIYDYFVEIM